MINMARCEKHGMVAHHTINVCKLCTTENGGTQPANAQQLKTKMPRVEDIISSVVGKGNSMHDVAVTAGINECYRYISRHFGH